MKCQETFVLTIKIFTAVTISMLTIIIEMKINLKFYFREFPRAPKSFTAHVSRLHFLLNWMILF